MPFWQALIYINSTIIVEFNIKIRFVKKKVKKLKRLLTGIKTPTRDYSEMITEGLQLQHR